MEEETGLEINPPRKGLASLEFLRSRRSMTKARPDPVPRELVERVIESATWAPNHRGTEPWRFVVLTGRARGRLGDLMAKRLIERAEGGTVEPGRIEKERGKPLRAPVVVAVAACPSLDPRVFEIEEVAATAAAIQNMLLAAQAVGLRAMWRTGEAAYDPEIKSFLGLPPESHLLAFLYLGYPEIVPPATKSRSSIDKTIWLTD